MTTRITKGLISIEMKNIMPAEVKKLRDIFVQLTDHQIHRIKNGKVILHFDKDGNLMKIDIQQVAWKRKKVIHSL